MRKARTLVPIPRRVAAANDKVDAQKQRAAFIVDLDATVSGDRGRGDRGRGRGGNRDRDHGPIDDRVPICHVRRPSNR